MAIARGATNTLLRIPSSPLDTHRRLIIPKLNGNIKSATSKKNGGFFMPAKNKKGESYGVGRTRNYASIVYPESASAEWQKVLAEQCVPAFISPLHEDLNPDDSEKKPHWHVMLMFESVKNIEQAQEVFNLIGAVQCKRIESVRGYARYLCHLDNPDKKQYEPSEVQAYGGADYRATIGLASDKYAAIREMLAFCQKADVKSYADLLMYASLHREDWFKVLCDNGTMVMKEYLKSKEWTSINGGSKIEPQTGKILNRETGEIYG